ncbi:MULTISPECIES: acyl-ACP desaturase [Streptomyces]|uniref:acyl-ACP desaturase n=1 Tax=Streptomyces TaxID=1883 RepID=UPI00188551E2|nr:MULTISPECIES: acyl-ACP desaturase [Streptomyces]MBF8170423.1 acyl-ACP desaturase [Streptomyces olivaceus]MBZ6259044.1 acyl-ACP desaturase [Streptomyces olivaceus]WFB85637.1 acyl-ACP desaturase [Streptomyces olivaceus]WGK48737.1 acyl-ACP desaturase [Streptomyces sp. B146]GHI94689.1 putative acyl-[acyl-carrier-protein] desaturase DesA2 [Streptomyces olivaceus]
MTSIALREAFHREFMTFFERAERTRRWSVFDDVPWDRLPEVPAERELALAAETFCGIEMFLPDYLQAHLSLLVGDYGQAWFSANWGYEEAKHALALREYLLRSGQRTETQMREFGEAVMARRWEPPYRTPRQMVVYSAFQELTTFVSYRKQRERAQRTADPVLAEVYRLIGRDEMAHCRFYQRILSLHLDEDRAGTLKDLAHVVRTFRMPAHELLPDREDRESVRTTGFGNGAFITEVVLPSLGALGLTRHDLYSTAATVPAAR